MKYSLTAIALALLVCASPVARALEVVTLITPLQLVVDEILGQPRRSTALIDARESPHHFQLRPSQLRQLAEADLVIWVSDHFETGLARLHAQLPASTQRLQLGQIAPAGLIIGQGHDIDGHLWLSPSAMAALAMPIAEQLARQDPANASVYPANARRLRQRIDAWLAKARQDFADGQPAYVLDHGFLAYFERDLGLASLGSLRDNHDQGGSMRHLSQLRRTLETRHANCLLVDRLPASAQARQVASSHDLQIRQLQVLGDPQSMTSIIDLYRHIVDVLAGCR